MSRSIWKGPIDYNSNLNRYSSVLPEMIEKSLKISNGKKEIQIKITKEMVGLKLGCLVRSKIKSKLKKK